MNSLYTLAVWQWSSIQADLERLHRSDASASLLGQISASLAGMSRTIDDYDSMAQTEIIKAKQEKATSYDYAEFCKEFERIKEECTAVQRTKLFSTSTGTPLTPGAGRRRFATGASTSMQLDTAPENPLREAHVLHEPNFIRSTEMRLDKFLAEGWEELDNLVDQHTILKGMQRRLRDAASTLTPSRASLAGSSAEVGLQYARHVYLLGWCHGQRKSHIPPERSSSLGIPLSCTYT
ncbi:golgi SNAP receptor complex member bos1 [Lactarius hatsudake]|nr:golgi SNAP receptor complex member bos1 [Lactarius hatsudake]